ncbi:hypothetical protein [Rhizobium sp. AC44/96]|uniref:hypothetical protein n=1 Tax=Rhizobium sp. AC44/96 TaxID=1841654 RepID=UPI001FCDE110|nr:hypothetical protein [Rhizobium sp. AC44/96]
MEADRGRTNVRKLSFPHWTRWLGIEHRCLVPVTSFAEPDAANKVEGGNVPNVWLGGRGDIAIMRWSKDRHGPS